MAVRCEWCETGVKPPPSYRRLETYLCERHQHQRAEGAVYRWGSAKCLDCLHWFALKRNGMLGQHACRPLPVACLDCGAALRTESTRRCMYCPPCWAERSGPFY